jgi:hypothetical protein
MAGRHRECLPNRRRFPLSHQGLNMRSKLVDCICRLPLNAKSVQLVGKKGGVEEGRAANLIQLFGGAVTVKLSSAAVPDKESDDTILIGPPFYLEACF